ncbi:PleD family two-component system response regulator [Mucilaginibacter sp.]
MQNPKELLYYCFNNHCLNSITNVASWDLVSINPEAAISSDFNCPSCGEKLISFIFDIILDNILELIKFKQTNIVILDDDLIFHCFAKQSLSQKVMNAQYTTDGYAVLNQLSKSIDYEDILPDIIFLDLDMPILNGWIFLDMFKAITKNLTKKIEIYIISSCEPTVINLLKYPFVKSFISKKSTLLFFKMLNQELIERQIMVPSIILQQPSI